LLPGLLARAGIRAVALTHVALTEDVVRVCLDDPDGGVRAVLAARPQVPAWALEQLARDEDVMNVGLPDHIVTRLAHGPDDAVRTAAATHPHLTSREATTLLDDPDPDVAQAASPALPRAVIRDLLSRLSG
jgi:hypothetical protein